MAKMRDAELAGLREKTKDMSRQEKAGYIWEYYKVYFIAALVLIVMGGTLLWDMHVNKLEQGYVHIGVVDSCAAQSQFYLELLARDNEWGEPLVFRPFVSAADSSGDGVIQIAASMAAQELDIIICDSNSLYFLLESGVSQEEDQIIPLLGTKLEEKLGGKDLCLVVMSGMERSEKAQEFAQLMLEQM